jgi:hypothetical protein
MELKQMPKTYDYMSFERHDLEAISSIAQDGSKTKLQEIQEALAEHKHWWGRRDIGLINVSDIRRGKPHHIGQLIIEPGPDGVPHCSDFVKELLTASEWKELVELNKKCIEAEKKYNLPPHTLTF